MTEVSTYKPKGMIRNKYLEYRRMYNRARNFSKDLASADSKDTAKKSEDTKKASEDKAADKSPEDTPNTKAMATGGGDPNALGNLPGNQGVTDLSPQMTRHTGRMQTKLSQYQPHIRAAAARYNLPEELIAGVIWQESRGNPRAVSHCGAMGLMQLMPGTAKQLGVGNAFSPSQNIDGGAKYLRQMLNKFGRVDFAVAAYNAGPGNVSKHGGIPPFRETQDYVPKVLGYANGFQVAGGFQDNTATTAVRV